MADQEHLDTLKQGIDAWNKWKKEHPDIEADLSEADFHRTSLMGAVMQILLGLTSVGQISWEPISTGLT